MIIYNKIQYIAQHQYQDWKKLGCSSKEYKKQNDDYLPLGPLRHLELQRNRSLETYFHHQNTMKEKEILDDGDLHGSELKTKFPKKLEGTKKEIGRFQDDEEMVEDIDYPVRNADVVSNMDDVSEKLEESWTDKILFSKQKKKIQVKGVVTSVHAEELLKIVQSDEVKVTGVTDKEEEIEENKKEKEPKNNERKIRAVAKNGLDGSSPQNCNKKRKYQMQTDLDYRLGEVGKELENDSIYWERIGKGKFMSEKR